MQMNDRVTGFVSEIHRRDGETIWISRRDARAVRDWTGRLVCYEGTGGNVTAKFEAQRIMREGFAQGRRGEPRQERLSGGDESRTEDAAERHIDFPRS